MAPEIYQGIVAYQSGDSTAAWTLVPKIHTAIEALRLYFTSRRWF